MVLSSNHEMSVWPMHWSKLKHSGKNMDVVLIKEMLQLGSIVSVSLRPLCLLYVIKRRRRQKKKQQSWVPELWHEWLWQLVITWLNKEGAAQHFSGPVNWQLSCQWQARPGQYWGSFCKQEIWTDMVRESANDWTKSCEQKLRGEQHIEILYVFLNSGGGVCQ